MKKLLRTLCCASLIVAASPSFALGGWFGQIFNDPLRATRNLVGNNANDSSGYSCSVVGSTAGANLANFVARQNEAYNVTVTYNFTDLIPDPWAGSAGFHVLLNDGSIWSKGWGGSGTITLPVVATEGVNVLDWFSEGFSSGISCTSYATITAPSFQAISVTNPTVSPVTPTTAVPEPSMFWLTIAGLGILGFRIRRRRNG